jgi:hypothetical protein
MERGCVAQHVMRLYHKHVMKLHHQTNILGEYTYILIRFSI